MFLSRLRSEEQKEIAAVTKEEPAHPPTLLQILPSLHSGGVERGTIEIARAAVKAGFRSLVASSGGPMVGQLVHCGATHITLPLSSKNPLTIALNIGRLQEVIKEYQVDIVHARSRAPAWSAYFASKKAGCHFVTTFHGIYKVSNSLKRAYNSVMLKGEKVIAISEFTAGHIREKYHFDSGNMVIIPRGADLHYFSPDKMLQHRMIQLLGKYHLPEDLPILLLPGRLTRWKGQSFLLEALRLLPRGSCYCLLVGDDKGHRDYRVELENKVRMYGLEGEVRIISHIQDIAAAYMLSDVVLSTSLEPEAFGRVAIEAQAMGKPVIATAIGGSCETVIPGKTGWLVEPYDTEALAQAITEAISLPIEQKKQMGETARAHVAAHFSLEQMCDKTIAVYRELLSKPSVS